MTQEYVIQRKGAVISEGENSFVPEEGLRAAEYRLIGNTPDAKASVILLCESRNPSQWAGIIGTGQASIQAGTCEYQGKNLLSSKCRERFYYDTFLYRTSFRRLFIFYS